MMKPLWYAGMCFIGTSLLLNTEFTPKGPRLLVLNFGCPFSKKIVSRVKALGAYAELRPYTISSQEIQTFNPDGIILSGGPASVPEKGSPRAPNIIFQLGCPILGICYGMQTMAEQLGGSVVQSTLERGVTSVNVHKSNAVVGGLGKELRVWMRHSDEVVSPPIGFEVVGSSEKTTIAIIADQRRAWYGVQFHPEASPNPFGKMIFYNFILETLHKKLDAKKEPFSVDLNWLQKF